MSPPRGTPAGIRADDLVHRYGKTTALDGLGFELAGGRIHGIVGPNGCGKTTLIRVLVGLLRPTGGQALVGLHEPRMLRRSSVPVGYMPQAGALYPELTVAQNIAFFAALNGLHGDERKTAVRAAMGRVQIEDRAKDRVHTLSGGMQRRVGLAAAIVHRPDYLFLDEPTVGVDPELRVAIWDDLRRLRDQGATILMSTHYLGEAENCDDVLLLRRGKAIAHGPPHELMRRTGQDGLEAAFVALVNGSPAARGAGP